jgi:hypothetical protein
MTTLYLLSGNSSQIEFVVNGISDANLKRYDVKPEDLAGALNKDPRVNGYVIFIASFHDEAERVKYSLPVGKGFVCLDTKRLPGIFKQVSDYLQLIFVFIHTDIYFLVVERSKVKLKPDQESLISGVVSPHTISKPIPAQSF